MDFSNLSPQDAMRAASEDLGLPGEFFDKMWKQESGRGTNMRSGVGARGHFQLMPGTQAVWEKRAGRSFDPDNFNDALTMAHSTMKENLAHFKDPVKATAAYNGGWDPRKWRNPETQGYIKSLWGDEQAAAAQPQEGFGGVAPAAFSVSADKSRAEQVARDSTSMIGALKESFYDTRQNYAWHFVEKAQAPERDAAFSYWDNPDRLELEGKTRNLSELQFLRENATSAEGIGWAMDQIETFRKKDEYLSNAGEGTALTAALVTGLLDPAGWVAGFGIGKGAQLARVGHAALAARGAKGAATAALIGENVLANVAMEAAADMTGQVKSLDDYAMAATFGAAFSTLGIPGIIQDANAHAIARNMDVETRRIQTEIIDRRMTDIEQGVNQESRAREQAREIDRAVSESTVIRPETERGDDVAIPRDLAEDIRRADEGTPMAPERTEPVDTTPPAERVTSVVEPRQATSQAADAAQATNPTETITAPAGAAPEAAPQASEPVVPWHEYARQVFALQTERANLLDGAGRRPRDQSPRRQQWDEVSAKIDALMKESSDLYAQRFKRADGSIVEEKPLPISEIRTETLGQALRGALESPALKDDTLTENAMNRVVINHLLDTAEKHNPAVLDKQVDFMGDILGKYSMLDDSISQVGEGGGANLKAKDWLGRNEANVLVHEATHAMVARTIQAVKKGVKGVPELAKQSVQRLEELMTELNDHMVKDGTRNRERNAGADYALSDIQEFAAQVINDTETKARLAELPGRGYSGDNGLVRAYRAVLGLLGFDPRKKVNSATEEAMFHVTRLIELGPQLPADISDAVWTRSFNAPHTLTAVADQKFADRMYDHARSWLARSPVDPKKLEVLAQQVLKKGGAARNYVLSDGLKLASSKNPVLNMMAGLVTEVTTGAVGRRTTAALKRDMLHQKLVGNSVTDYHTAYNDYRARNAGGHVEDWLKGEVKRKFDKEVYAEIVGRRYGNQPHIDAAVRQGADALEPMFQRSLDAQKQASTLGSGLLPPDAKGYIPQALDGDALANASAPQLEMLANHLADHWQNVNGWTKEFATPFSRTYISRAKKRANGQDGIDFVATESPTGAVRDTLEEMRLNSRSLNARALAELDRVGAQPQNKKRLDVDMLKTLPDGTRVMDFYSTNIEQLARQHVNRVAGSVALADFNVLGQRGVNNILMTVDLAPPELRASPEEREAMARVFSEFLGQPVKGEVRSRLATNIAGATRMQRLGGLAFTQLAEMGNIMSHLGMTSMFKGLAELPRMVNEIRTLKNGGQLSNAWLSSLEKAQGFEYGMEGFRMVARLDAPDDLLRQYGKGNDLATRVIAGGNHLQSQLSFFRGLQAAQHRGVAELILKKAISYINDGGSDVYLRDMGISPELARAIKGDLPRALIRDANGVPAGFDITLLSTTKAQTDLLAAIHRGTGQIIQRTFIGERGAWAHNDVAKLLLQLRTFSLTAMEKQWGRTRVINSNGPLNGYGHAAGVLMGQMAFAIPIYLARAGLYSVGKPDQEAFIDRATQPARLVQAALNYSAGSGLAGDALDMVASLGGGWSGEVQSALGTKSFGGGVGAVIPAAGSIDDAWKVLSGKSSLERSLKQLPMSNLPWIAPIINLTAED